MTRLYSNARILVLAILLAGAMFAAPMGCVVSPPEQAGSVALPDPAAASPEGSEGEDGPVQDPQARNEEASGAALTGGTMHIGETLKCLNEFGRICTSTFPAPQCPPGTYDGQPCYPATGWTCYRSEGLRFSQFWCY